MRSEKCCLGKSGRVLNAAADSEVREIHLMIPSLQLKTCILSYVTLEFVCSFPLVSDSVKPYVIDDHHYKDKTINQSQITHKEWAFMDKCTGFQSLVKYS